MRNSFNKRLKQARGNGSIFEALEDRRLFASVFWTGGGGSSDWSNRFNWMGNTVPGANDDVTINGNFSVQLSSANATVRSLQLGSSGNTSQLTVRNGKRLQCSFANVMSGATLQVSDAGEVDGFITNATGGKAVLRDGVIGGSVSNYGTIESYYRASGTTPGDGITGTVTNYSSGTIRVVGNSAYGHNLIVPTINNQGGLIEMTGAVPDGQRLALGWEGTETASPTIINNQYGTINIQTGGQRWLYGSLGLTSGALNVPGSLGITQEDSTPSFISTGQVTLAGKLTLERAVLNVSSPLSANSSTGILEATKSSTVNFTAGVWPDIASVKVSDSSINGDPNNYSTFTIPQMHILKIDGIATFGRSLVNRGTVILGTGEQQFNTLSVSGMSPSFETGYGGGFSVAANSTGTLDCYFTNNTGGITSIDGTLQFNTVGNSNWGKININDRGTLLAPEAGFTNPMGGVIRLSPLGTFDTNGGMLQNYGRIEGFGRIVGNVTNNGVLAPGGIDDPMFPNPASIGILTIDGNCSFGSTTGVLNAELKGTTAGTQYDRLVVTGTATLASGLYLSRPSGFVPVAGNTFDVLQAGTRTGTFATVGGTDLPGGGLLGVSYLATSARVGVIGNPVVPAIKISDAFVNEPSSGTTTANFTVTLDQAANLPVTVAYTTANGSAVAPDDYVAASGTLTFAPGQTSQSISIVINSDVITENAENFMLNLGSPTNGTIADGQGIATIFDAAHPGLIASVPDVALIEGQNGSQFARFNLSLSDLPAAPVIINYATADGTATLADNDYAATSGSVTFVPGGDSSISILVPVLGDAALESDETFVLNISSPSSVVLAQSRATATISNDDVNYSTGGYYASYVPLGGVGASFTSLPDAVPYNLQGHSFNFFGTQYATVYANLNGTITFDGPMNDPNNTDLSQLTRPMIASLWDDWTATSSTPLRAAIVPGSNLGGLGRTHDYLLMRWVSVRHPGDTVGYTFTTAMELDSGATPGEVLVWTNNLSSAATSATVGLCSGAGARLLAAFNRPDPVFAPGIAVRMGQLLPAPTKPSAPALAAGDDTGVSNSDGLTNRLRPTFNGTAPAGAQVHVLADGIEVASGSADSDGAYSFACFRDLFAGAHTIRAFAATGDGMSLASAPLQLTLDVTAPAADVVDVTPDPRSTAVNAITVTFSEAVYDLDLSDLVLTRNGGANLLNGTQTLTQVNDRTWLLDGLNSLTAPRGDYLLTVHRDDVFDLAGNALAADASDSWRVTGKVRFGEVFYNGNILPLARAPFGSGNVPSPGFDSEDSLVQGVWDSLWPSSN